MKVLKYIGIGIVVALAGVGAVVGGKWLMAKVSGPKFEGAKKAKAEENPGAMPKKALP